MNGDLKWALPLITISSTLPPRLATLPKFCVVWCGYYANSFKSVCIWLLCQHFWYSRCIFLIAVATMPCLTCLGWSIWSMLSSVFLYRRYVAKTLTRSRGLASYFYCNKCLAAQAAPQEKKERNEFLEQQLKRNHFYMLIAMFVVSLYIRVSIQTFIRLNNYIPRTIKTRTHFLCSL